MNLFSVLHLAAGISLAPAYPDVAFQPDNGDVVREDQGANRDRPHQPFETPDQPAENARPETGATTQETVIPIPEHEREVPQGQY